MPVTIHDREITRVLIVDDEPAAQDGYGYAIEELGLDPVMISGPLDSTQSFIERAKPSDAVVSDYRLKMHSYAACDGDVLVADCFKAGIPGMLCTTFTDVDVTIRRDCLRYIPALVKTISPDPDTFVAAWDACVAEMNGEVRSSRRAWRTLVRVADVVADGKYFHAVVPAWKPRQKIRLYYDSIPDRVRRLLEPDARFHAQVNLGADGAEDLFFDSWETE